VLAARVLVAGFEVLTVMITKSSIFWIITDKLAMAEHGISLGHHIQLLNTSILSTEHRYMDRIIWEVTNTQLHPSNIRRMASASGNHVNLSFSP
jgi:hypothetical protein